MTSLAPPGSPTDDLLTMRRSPSRTTGFRVDVLDQRLTKVGELHPARPGLSVEQNINRDVKRTMSGFVIPRTEAVSLNFFAHRARPVWLASDQTEWPLGVFLISDASTIRHSWGTTAELSFADQGLILSQSIDRSVGYGAGTYVREAMLAVLAAIGLPAYEVDQTEARLGAHVTWGMGRDSWIRVLNDLADLAGFNSGFFDNSGTYRLRRAPAANDEAVVDFDYDAPPRVYEDSIVESEATLESPNRYVVISTSANSAPIFGTWDVPPDAPHSYENRGYRVVSVVERQGLGLAEATEAARIRGLQDADTYQWASFSAAPDPRHDTFNVVRWRGEVWREQSWSLNLDVGAEHRHELRRSYRPSTPAAAAGGLPPIGPSLARLSRTVG